MISLEKAHRVIRCAKLQGFGGECGRVSIAINNVLFAGKGKYVIVTNQPYNKVIGDLFTGHVLVEWKGRLFDATGLIEDEETVLTFGQFDDLAEWEQRLQDLGLDKDPLTEDQRYEADLWYIDEVGNKRAQEKLIIEQTAGKCLIKNVEHALKKCLEKL